MLRPGSAVAVGDAAGTTLVLTQPPGLSATDIIAFNLYIETLALTPSFDKGTWTKITAASGENTVVTAFAIHVYWVLASTIASWPVTVSWGGASTFRVGTYAAYTGRISTGADPQDSTATFAKDTVANTALIALANTAGHDDVDVIVPASCVDAATYKWSGVNERIWLGNNSFADTNQASPGTTGNKLATLSGAANWSVGVLTLQRSVPPPDYNGRMAVQQRFI